MKCVENISIPKRKEVLKMLSYMSQFLAYQRWQALIGSWTDRGVTGRLQWLVLWTAAGDIFGRERWWCGPCPPRPPRSPRSPGPARMRRPLSSPALVAFPRHLLFKLGRIWLQWSPPSLGNLLGSLCQTWRRGCSKNPLFCVYSKSTLLGKSQILSFQYFCLGNQSGRSFACVHKWSTS